MHKEAIKTAKEIEQCAVESLIRETLNGAINVVPVIANEINPLWCDIFDKVEVRSDKNEVNHNATIPIY